MIHLESTGNCPICGNDATFRSNHPWLRDHFICQRCGSLPRERALMAVLKLRVPSWKHLTVHESSPADRGVSTLLAKECCDYIPTHYFSNVDPGSTCNGFRCENMESMTFPDGSIDLHISQDVLEHVLHPDLAFKEIARTLRPGGYHIFTVPMINKSHHSFVRATQRVDGTIDYIVDPVYHGNPINDAGSLVVTDWGYDICRFIFNSSGLFTEIHMIDDLSQGIRAEFNEVLLTYKPTDNPQF